MPERMVANRRFLYNTRWMNPGTSFTVPDWRIARILKLKGDAREDYETAVPPVDPAAEPAQPAQPEPGSLDALRIAAEAAGVQVDRRWGEARLRQEIASAGRQKPPEPSPQAVPAMTMTTHGSTVSGGTSVSGGASTVSGAVNVGSTAHPVYRRNDE